MRAATSPTVVDTFLAEGLGVAAGVRQQLEVDVRRSPACVFCLTSSWNQAVGLPCRYGKQAALALYAFVEEMKASGFVAEALQRHGIRDTSVAAAKPVPDPTS